MYALSTQCMCCDWVWVCLSLTCVYEHVDIQQIYLCIFTCMFMCYHLCVHSSVPEHFFNIFTTDLWVCVCVCICVSPTDTHHSQPPAGPWWGCSRQQRWPDRCSIPSPHCGRLWWSVPRSETQRTGPTGQLPGWGTAGSGEAGNDTTHCHITSRLKPVSTRGQNFTTTVVTQQVKHIITSHYFERNLVLN